MGESASLRKYPRPSRASATSHPPSRLGILRSVTRTVGRTRCSVSRAEFASGALSFIDKDTIPARRFKVQDGIRVVPGGSSVREGAYLAPGAERVAAFFCEPVIGAGGVYPPPEGYIEGVADLCAEHGVLLVVDSVICGFGRLGTWFGIERWEDVRPDLITFAKGVTSGYLPLGGVIASGKVAAPFFEGPGGPMLRHGATYAGHPTCCAAAPHGPSRLRAAPRCAAGRSSRPSGTADPAAREAAYVLANTAIREQVPMVPISHAGFANAYVAGVEGSGHHELLLTLAGRFAPSAGEVRIPDAIGFIPEHRQRDALIPAFSLVENIALRDVARARGRMHWPALAERARRIVARNGIRAASVLSPVRALSGGNQQKLVLARELDATPPLVVAENPTQGLDVRAAMAIRARLRAARERDGAVLLIEPQAIMYLLGTEMDYKADKMQSQLIFNNPNQTSACGCGESVAISPAQLDTAN